MGVDVNNTKLLAFVLGALLAGLAGALNAHLTFFIGPNEYGFDRGVEILTMTILGGIGSIAGPVVGAVILTVLPEMLRAFNDFRLVINGLILILIVLFLPKGIWDPSRMRRWFGRNRQTGGHWTCCNSLPSRKASADCTCCRTSTSPSRRARFSG